MNDTTSHTSFTIDVPIKTSKAHRSTKLAEQMVISQRVSDYLSPALRYVPSMQDQNRQTHTHTHTHTHTILPHWRYSSLVVKSLTVLHPQRNPKEKTTSLERLSGPGAEIIHTRVYISTFTHTDKNRKERREKCVVFRRLKCHGSMPIMGKCWGICMHLLES